MTVSWSPSTRAQRNAHARFTTWRVLKIDNHKRALLVPLSKKDQPIMSERFWVEPEQLEKTT